MLRKLIAFCLLMFLMTEDLNAQPKGYLYDEAKVPKYEIIDPLKFSDGQLVSLPDQWARRRAEILRLFEKEVYGKSPSGKFQVSVLKRESKKVLNNRAVMEQVRLKLTKTGPEVDVLIFYPAGSKKVPAFLGLNFLGNHTVFDDPSIWITPSWVRNDKRLGVKNNQANELGRGKQSRRWSIEQIIDAGMGLVTVYYGDIDPDFDDQFKNGIHGALSETTGKLTADSWGSIAGWSFGLSRVLDFLELEPNLDAKKVIVFGHSRLGKTALWAGATDERFAGVISNNSGCGGAALSKRTFGETVKRINKTFPHWFCDNFVKYNDKEQDLPLDQHMLIALSAPRPIYVASASKDLWADPKGEFLAAFAASPVYKLLTGRGIEIEQFPKLNEPSLGIISYHCRDGSHDVTDFDWSSYIKFAKKHLK